jgi:hypothetical protein
MRDEPSGLALGTRPNGNLAQALGHAGLPPRPSGAPAGNHVGWQAQRDELSRVDGLGAPTLLHHRASKHFIGELRQQLVLGWLDAMRINASQIRL